MKVLVLTNMYPTTTEPWAGSFVAEQVEDLRRLGVDIDVSSFDGRLDRKAYFREVSKLRRVVREGDFDLMHAHYGLTGAVALTQRRIPTVTTFHGSDTFIPWQRFVSWVVARLTTAVFVSDLGRRRLHLADAAIIPCAVDTERFRPRNQAEARAELGWDATASYAVFPGSRRNPVKRVDLFDAAVEEARRGLPELRAIALEGLSRDEAALTLAAADVTVMTSDREGSPVTVRESLACETPVVSVSVGDVPEVISDLPGCAICERDPSALARALLRAIDAGRSPDLRKRAEETSRPRVARSVIAVYERALATRVKSRR